MIVTGNWIQVASGTYFDYEHPERSTFTLYDIAHALSNTCRFGGHCCKFYSVAQHSVLVSRLLAPCEMLAGLLHDASEAFCCDIPSPLKSMIPGYKEIEKRVMTVILREFGVLEMPKSVHQADMILMATERRDLLNPTGDLWPCLEGIEPLKERIEPWSHVRARELFMETYSLIDSIVNP